MGLKGSHVLWQFQLPRTLRFRVGSFHGRVPLAEEKRSPGAERAGDTGGMSKSLST